MTSNIHPQRSTNPPQTSTTAGRLGVLAVPRRYYRTAIDRAGLGASVHAFLSGLSTSATSSGEIPRGEGPGIDTVAERVGISRATAYRALKIAEDDGWLEVDHQRGRRRTNGYRLVIPFDSEAGARWTKLEARAVDQAHAEALAERKPRRRPATGSKPHRTAERKTSHHETRVDVSRSSSSNPSAPDGSKTAGDQAADALGRGMIDKLPDKIRREIRPRGLRAALRTAVDKGWTDGAALYRRVILDAEAEGLPGDRHRRSALGSDRVDDITDALAGRIRKAGAPPRREEYRPPLPGPDAEVNRVSCPDGLKLPPRIANDRRRRLARKVAA